MDSLTGNTSAMSMYYINGTTALRDPMLYEIERLANRSTRARRRAEAMGFTFGPVRATAHELGRPDLLYVTLDGGFKCVCGTQEYYRTHTTVDKSKPLTQHSVLEETDVAQFLWGYGSFSDTHLRSDGYSAEAIAGFRAKEREFETHEAIELMREAQTMGRHAQAQALALYLREVESGHVSDRQAAPAAAAPVCKVPDVAMQPAVPAARPAKPRANDPWYRRFACERF